MRTPEEILDYHLHQMGKYTVGLHESDLYECAINAIKEALTIPAVGGRSEQYHCELYDFGRKDKPCDKQCDGCKAMNLD